MKSAKTLKHMYIPNKYGLPFYAPYLEIYTAIKTGNSVVVT